MHCQPPDTAKLTLSGCEYKDILNEDSEQQRWVLLDNSTKNLSLNCAAQVFLQTVLLNKYWSKAHIAHA